MKKETGYTTSLEDLEFQWIGIEHVLQWRKNSVVL